MMCGDERRAQMVYNQFMGEDERANLCVECGECLRSIGAVPVDKCPQGIEIPDWLAKVREVLGAQHA